MDERAFAGRQLSPGDIEYLVLGLLAAIERGQLEATPAEIEFLRSVAGILAPVTA